MSDEMMIPPHSIEAEQAVLGAILTSGNASPVMDLINEEAFYRNQNQIIWKAITALSDRNEPVDPLTVAEHLGQSGELDAAGGRGYLGSLAMSSTSPANIRSYAEIIADKASRRHLLRAASEIMQAAHQSDSAREALDQAQSSIMQIGADSEASGPVAIRDAMEGWIEQMQARAESDGGVTGLPTGYADLDMRTTGLHSGNLVVVGGRPGMGKTSFAMGMLAECGRNNRPALVFSMEMSREELSERAVSASSRVDLHSIRSAKLTNEQWEAITLASGKIKSWPLYIDDTPALKIAQIRARSRRIKQRYGLDLVVVDYMSLAKGEGENRNNEIGDVSQGLKALAKELRIPVVALAQLNRGVENRQDKRPTLRDLRESGQIEQDADIIIFLYRDKVYDPNTNAGDIAEVIIGKQRNGATSKLPMIFRDTNAQYLDAAPGTKIPGPKKMISAMEAVDGI